MTDAKVQGKFYPLQHDEFLRLNAELKDAELRVYLYLMTFNPFPNSVMEIDTAQISEQLGLTRRTIQRAIKRLQELQLLEIEISRFKYKKALHGASSRLGSGDTRIANGDTRIANDDTRIANDDTRIANGDTRIANDDTRIANGDTRIANGDTRIANDDTRIANADFKSLPDNASSTPHINQTYPNCLNSLSEAEKEDFENFVREEYRKDTKQEINSFPAFVRGEFFKDWYQRYQNRPEAVQSAANEKWRNDPRFEEWLTKCRQGYVAFICESGKIDPERKAFFEWANANKILWGVKS